MAKVSLDVKKVFEGIIGKLDLNKMLIESLPVVLPKLAGSSPAVQQLLGSAGLTVDQLAALVTQGAQEAAQQPAEYEVPKGGARLLMRNWEAVTDADIRSALNLLWDDPEMTALADSTADLLWHLIGKSAVRRMAAAAASAQPQETVLEHKG